MEARWLDCSRKPSEAGEVWLREITLAATLLIATPGARHRLLSGPRALGVHAVQCTCSGRWRWVYCTAVYCSLVHSWPPDLSCSVLFIDVCACKTCRDHIVILSHRVSKLFFWFLDFRLLQLEHCTSIFFPLLSLVFVFKLHFSFYKTYFKWQVRSAWHIFSDVQDQDPVEL